MWHDMLYRVLDVPAFRTHAKSSHICTSTLSLHYSILYQVSTVHSPGLNVCRNLLHCVFAFVWSDFLCLNELIFCVYLTGIRGRCYIISDLVWCIMLSSKGAFVNSEDDMHWYTAL